MSGGEGGRVVDAHRETGDGHARVTVDLEERLVLLCQGYERHDADFRGGPELVPQLPRYQSSWVPWEPLTLERNSANRATMRSQSMGPLANLHKLELVPVGADEWTYENRDQGVRYRIKRFTHKSDFRDALQHDGAFVLYLGHARWGRGPCFGPDGGRRGENWGDGDAQGSVDTGIFRMGHPYLSIPLEEISEHNYTPTLYRPTQPIGTGRRPHETPAQRRRRRAAAAHQGPPAERLLPADDCDPELLRHIDDLRVEELHSLEPRLSNLTNQPVLTHQAFHNQVEKTFVVHQAGWRGTMAREVQMELAQTEIRCRLLCFFGCDSLHHFRPVLRFRHGWQRMPDDRFAYFNNKVAQGCELYFWLYHMLAYPEPSAHLPLDPLMRYVRRLVNRDLAHAGKDYQVI